MHKTEDYKVDMLLNVGVDVTVSRRQTAEPAHSGHACRMEHGKGNHGLAPTQPDRASLHAVQFPARPRVRFPLRSNASHKM